MSAAEMKCFILNACLIFGELIPRKNKVWKLYLLLRQIVSITLQSSVSCNDVELLCNLIEEHHSLYIKLFGETLKPKHHNMLHYARIMEIIGPLVHIWTMWFEAKHRPLKQSASTSNNRINLPYTIAMKQQLHLAKLFLDKKIFDSSITYEKLNNPNERPIVKLPNIDLNTFYQIKYFVIDNIKYDVNTVIKLLTSDTPIYGRISNILKEKENSINAISDVKIAFIVKVLKCVKRDNHFQSYQLKDTNEYKFILYQSLLYLEPRNEVSLANGMIYVSYDNHMF